MSSKPPARRRRLSEKLIVETALALAQRHGTGALTVRRLGAELGADATAMYRYFRSKEDLLLLMASHILETVADTVPDDLPWRENLAVNARRIVEEFTRHPAVGAVIADVSYRRPDVVRDVERGMTVFKDAGLDDDDAVLLYRVYVDFILGYAAYRAERTLRQPQRLAAEALWREAAGSLPSDRFPHTVRVGIRLVEVSDDDVLQGWIDMFIRDVVARASR